MNTHKNARLTYARRIEMVRDVVDRGMTPCAAAAAHGVSAPTARKWGGPLPGSGRGGSGRPLLAASAQPARDRAGPGAGHRRVAPPAPDASTHRANTGGCQQHRQPGTGPCWPVEAARPQPAEPVIRYERQVPGELLHIDIKKLGRIERPSHRVTGNRRDTTEGAGWEFLFVAIDDHARIGFTDMHPDERAASAVLFLRNAVAYYHSLGVRIRRVLTDNGGAFHSAGFAQTCKRLGIQQRFTRAYRPQTNGKAERFIQSALREWAYAFTYQNSQQRTTALDDWIHHYNWHRPHQGIGGLPPMSRLSASRNNLLTLHN